MSHAGEPSKSDFDHGDRVRVDWSDGDGLLDEIVGIVSGISRSGVDVIITVEADDGQYPENSIYYGTHDAAPAWVEPL